MRISSEGSTAAKVGRRVTLAGMRVRELAKPRNHPGVRLCLGVSLGLASVFAALSAQGQTEAPQPPSEPPPHFYFFSPDWRPADLSTLTERVHTALLEQGFEITFQAFARYEDFSRQVVASPPQFLIAPGWFQNTAASDLGLFLQPIATPLRHHHTTYRKALFARSDIKSITDLTRGSIAASIHSLGPGSESAVLDTIHLEAGSAKVVAVPKDVDGLLALGFGQVDAALATAQQYELLVASNPEAAAKLQVIAFSTPIPLPAVFAGQLASAEDRRRMAAALARFSQSEAGHEVLSLLGYDSFEPVASVQQAEQPGPAPVTKPASQTRQGKAQGKRSAESPMRQALPGEGPAPTAPAERPDVTGRKAAN